MFKSKYEYFISCQIFTNRIYTYNCFFMYIYYLYNNVLLRNYLIIRNSKKKKFHFNVKTLNTLKVKLFVQTYCVSHALMSQTHKMFKEKNSTLDNFTTLQHINIVTQIGSIFLLHFTICTDVM